VAFELLCGEIKESGRHGYPPTVSATLGLEPDTRRRSKSGGKNVKLQIEPDILPLSA